MLHPPKEMKSTTALQNVYFQTDLEILIENRNFYKQASWYENVFLSYFKISEIIFRHQ